MKKNLFRSYNKVKMGRAARNHGGTGGHGCVPLPGERPNYNRHVMSDKTLLSLVSSKDRKKQQGPGENRSQLGQQKVSDEQIQKLISPRQLETLATQSVTSAKQEMNFVQKPVSSVKEILTSSQEPLISAKQPVTLANKSVSSPKQLLTPAKNPVISANHPITRSNQQLPSTRLPVSSAGQSLTSADQPVTSSNQFVTSADQKDTSDTLPKKKLVSSKQVKHPAASAKQLESSGKQHVKFGKQAQSTVKQPMTRDDKTLTKAKQPVKSNKLQKDPNIETVTKDIVTSKQPLETFPFVQQPITTIKYPETSVEQPKVSCEQSVIPGASVQHSMSPPLHFINLVEDPQTSSQQHVTRVKQQFSEAQHPVTSIKHTGASQPKLSTAELSFLQPNHLPSSGGFPWVSVPVYQPFNYYLVYATFLEMVSVSPQISNFQMRVNSHLDIKAED